MSHLHVRGLQVSYVTGRQLVPAVEDFNLSVAPGEVIGLRGGERQRQVHSGEGCDADPSAAGGDQRRRGHLG